jgi:hypothetical protein
MITTIEIDIFGDDPRLDGTRIPNQEEWSTLVVEAPVMPYRPEDYRSVGQPSVFFALRF